MLFQVSAALLDSLVLAIVERSSTYGYKITQDMRSIISVSESTLYPVLRRLLSNDFLETFDQEFLGRNRRYYKLTPTGRIQLEIYRREWENYKNNVDSVLKKADLQ